MFRFPDVAIISEEEAWQLRDLPTECIEYGYDGKTVLLFFKIDKKSCEIYFIDEIVLDSIEMLESEV